jgi:hypothetical protein
VRNFISAISHWFASRDPGPTASQPQVCKPVNHRDLTEDAQNFLWGSGRKNCASLAQVADCALMEMESSLNPYKDLGGV